ncbi:MAG: hypothetical protein JOZ76_25570 [Bradyrhizobium sp.]|nr:hypothetical protein [Bradyrhizobium sp.]MBV8921407.1 hypothetical protein [Bradyrhizobium sp.]
MMVERVVGELREHDQGLLRGHSDGWIAPYLVALRGSGNGVLLASDGLIRGKWSFQGVVITDDLVMGAIYGGNVCAAVVEALNAGADLLLVAYDRAQFYRVFDCALDAYRRGRLDLKMLRASEEWLMLAAGEVPAASM